MLFFIPDGIKLTCCRDGQKPSKMHDLWHDDVKALCVRLLLPFFP